MKHRILTLFVSAALAAPFACAAATPRADDDAARRAELAKAREALAENARRVAELSRGLDEEGFEFRFENLADPRRPGVGIVMSDNEGGDGVRLAAVTPDGPAAKAGLRAGDVLLSVNGKTISASGTQAVDNARDLIGDLKKGQQVKLRYARQGKTFDASMAADDINRLVVFNRGEGLPRHHDGGMRKRMMMLPPGVETEILRVGPRKHPCAKGEEDCGMPALVQAFRWQGLNLSSMDAGLGRYFGTDKGVLVISAGPELKGLQSGDVIQRVGGKPVESPRDVMRALRDKDEGAQLQLNVLRDRKPQAVSITVPKSRPLPFMEPPAPPAPAAP